MRVALHFSTCHVMSERETLYCIHFFEMCMQASVLRKNSRKFRRQLRARVGRYMPWYFPLCARVDESL